MQREVQPSVACNRRLNLELHKWNRIAAVLISALLILVLSVTNVCAAEMSLCGDETTKKPNIKAKSAIVYSIDSDYVVYEKDADTRRNPYSITKLITVYIALKNLDMDKKVTISKTAADDISDGSTMKLEPGEKVTVRDLVYGAMILSGNDAAMALAEAVSGSEAKFAQLMNDTVKEWGCTNTHFNNAWGNKSKNHYTTARDMMIISKVVLADEEIHKIITTQIYKMPKTNKSGERIMPRHTVLANVKNSGVIGGKTGRWEDDDTTVAALYNKNQLSLIFVLLKDGDKQRSKDAVALFKYAHKATLGYIVDRKGAQTKTAWVKGGAKTRLKTELSKTIHAYPVNQKASKVKTKINLNKLKAPIKKGTVVGTYAVYVDKKLIAEEPIVASESIKKGWILSNIYISNTTTICLVIIIVLATSLIFIMKRRKIQKVGKH